MASKVLSLIILCPESVQCPFKTHIAPCTVFETVTLRSLMVVFLLCVSLLCIHEQCLGVSPQPGDGLPYHSLLLHVLKVRTAANVFHLRRLLTFFCLIAVEPVVFLNACV